MYAREILAITVNFYSETVYFKLINILYVYL